MAKSVHVPSESLFTFTQKGCSRCSRICIWQRARHSCAVVAPQRAQFFIALNVLGAVREAAATPVICRDWAASAVSLTRAGVLQGPVWQWLERGLYCPVVVSAEAGYRIGRYCRRSGAPIMSRSVVRFRLCRRYPAS